MEKKIQAGIPEWLKTICDKAISYDHISMEHLCMVLGFDDQYDVLLHEIWKKYQLDKRDSKEPNIETPEDRSGAWFKLLLRFVYGTVAGISDGIDVMPCLKIRRFDKETGLYKDATPLDFSQRNLGPIFISLADLKVYFKTILKISLPALLFPLDDTITAQDNSEYGEYYFVKTGDYWEARFGDEKRTIKDLKGLRAVVFLLENPNKEFYPVQFQNFVDKRLISITPETAHYQNMTKPQIEGEEYLNFDDVPIEQIPYEDKKKFENIIYDLWSPDMDESDPRWQKICNLLSSEYGLTVVSKPDGPRFYYNSKLNLENEKARKSIQKNVTAFKKRIKNMPKLKQHLDRNMHFGYKSSYSPDPLNPVIWYIRD